MKLVDLWKWDEYNFLFHKGNLYYQTHIFGKDDKLILAIPADKELPQPLVCLYREECENETNSHDM